MYLSQRTLVNKLVCVYMCECMCVRVCVYQRTSVCIYLCICVYVYFVLVSVLNVIGLSCLSGDGHLKYMQ